LRAGCGTLNSTFKEKIMNEIDVMNRLGRLERSNRRLKLAATACALGVVAAVFVAAERASGPMAATEYKLVDDNGRLRGAFGQDKDGTFFYLNDDTGKMRASIAAQKTGTFMNLKDADGKTRAIVSFDEDGPTVRLRDDKSGTTATMLIDDRGPSLQLHDATGKTRIFAPMIDVLEEPRGDRNPPPPGK
jgi:hypothetical protein